MSKVWKEAPYAEGDLLVLLALADWSDDQGNCWVKIALLGRKCRLSDRAVQYAIRKLQVDGVVELMQESQGNQPRGYRISGKFTVPEISIVRGAKSAPLKGRGVQSETPEMRQIAPPYKEKQRLKATNTNINIRDLCKTCGGLGKLHQDPNVPGPRLISCPDCQNQKSA